MIAMAEPFISEGQCLSFLNLVDRNGPGQGLTMDDTLAGRVLRRARSRGSTSPSTTASTGTGPLLGATPEPSAAPPRGLQLPAGWLFGLLVPADPQHPCAVLSVRDNASGLSDAIGGALLDERAVDGRPPHRCWLYLDEARRARRLPPNRCLARLAAELGWPRTHADGWLGPALITGRDLHWADRDVPAVVVATALTTQNRGA
jgi:hypothetical protein